MTLPADSTNTAATFFPDGFLGVVMLDTQFPRPESDIGHSSAFGVPTRRCVIAGAWPEKIVQSGSGLRKGRVVTPILQLVRRLENDGAKAITTSCGFLVPLQKVKQLPHFLVSLGAVEVLAGTAAGAGTGAAAIDGALM